MAGDYMTDDGPCVDILIPTIGRRSLEMAILSACHQTYRHTRVIVVGDGEQKTARIIVRVMKKLYGAIHYWETPTPHGHGDGVRLWWLQQEECSKWVKFLDDDDVLHPKCLTTMMPLADKGVSAIMCSMQVAYAAGEVVTRGHTHGIDRLEVGHCGTGQLLVDRDAGKECNWPHRPEGELIFMRGLEAHGKIRTVKAALYWYLAYRDNKVRYQ